MKICGLQINNFNIVCADDLTSKTATNELQLYLQKYCNYSCQNATNTIYVGCFPSKLADILPLDQLKNDDSFLIKTVEQDLYLYGKTPEGTLYAVYHFLNLLGIDWLTPDVEIAQVNLAQDIKIDLVYNFSAQIRQAHGYTMLPVGEKQNKFRIRQRLITTVGETNNKPFFGGIKGYEYAFDWGLFGHTFEWFIPYDEYFATHPEYFSFAPGHYGEKGKNQICLTNPNVIEIVKRKTLDYLEKNPSCKVVSISQNDAYEDFVDNLCMCENCKKIYEQEGNRYSGVLINFVNQIADAVAERYPDVLIHTFGYKQTTAPPLYVKPRKNVMVQVCLSHKPHWTLLSDEADSIRCKKQFDDWHDACQNVHVWTYLLNHSFYFLPIANLESLYVDTTYMLKKGVYGIFQQDNGDDFPYEFSDLRMYLIAKLFQHPEMSYEEYLGYVNKFLQGFYCKSSAKYILDYLLLLEDLYASDTSNSKSSQKSYEMLSGNEAVFDNKDFIQQASDLWAKALQNAENEVYKARIENSKKSFDYAELVYLYANISNEQDLQEYARKKKALYKYASEQRGFLIYGESWARRVHDLSKIDWTTAPRVLRNVDKKILLKGKDRSALQHSDENTNPDIDNFYFTFDIAKVGNTLDFCIEIADDNCTHVRKIDDWEQDSIELYFSESLHKKTIIGSGDFHARINANGDWTAFGKENKFSVSTQKTEIGYKINVRVAFDEQLLAKGNKIGFEIIAHNIGDNGYINTVYWNATKRSIMSHYPALCGQIIIE